MQKRNLFNYPTILAIVLVSGIFIGYILSGSKSISIFSSSDNGINKLNEVLHLIQKDYVDTINEKELIEKTLTDVLHNLDPHSTYIPAESFQNIEDQMSGNFDGIGVQFRIQRDSIVVVMPISGGPSAKKGIRAGDRIVGVDGKDLSKTKITNDTVMKLLKGPKGSKVLLTIYRPSIQDYLEFEIKRDKIPVYSIDIAFMPQADIGYIKINRFAATTYQEFVEKTNQMKKSGMRKLIVDLRDNGGGYLRAATNLSNDFLDGGTTIVYTIGKNRSKEIISATSKTRLKGIDLVILINEYSASASEIVSGAIQDNSRGKIIGRRSFGKGLVQEQLEFIDKSAIRLTVARYYTPSGRCIQKSYKEGYHEYEADLYNRYSNEELINPDSIHFSDTVKYYTTSGKVVYGGGGIMPDIFVPIDTNRLFSYFNKLSGRGLIYQYAFDYVDTHREKLIQKYKTPQQFIKSFPISDNMMKELIALGEKNKIKFNDNSYVFCKKDIKTRMKAYIGRGILDNDAFYPIILSTDKAFIKAMNTLEP